MASSYRQAKLLLLGHSHLLVYWAQSTKVNNEQSLKMKHLLDATAICSKIERAIMQQAFLPNFLFALTGVQGEVSDENHFMASRFDHMQI